MAKSNRTKAAKNKKDMTFGTGDKYPIFIDHQGFHLDPDIKSGDLLRIDPVRSPEDGDFVFARILDGSLVVQKYIVLDAQDDRGARSMLVPTDELIERQTWTAEEFTVLGVVIQIERRLHRWKADKVTEPARPR